MEKLYLFLTRTNDSKMQFIGAGVTARTRAEAFANARSQYGVAYPVFL